MRPQHKHVPYGHIETTMSVAAGDDKMTPLLKEGEEDLDANVPPLNAEDPLFGLRSAQVAACLEIFGTNEIIIPETPLWKLFVKQFVGFLPLLIELAALISLGVQDWVDFGIIAAILLINACLGFHEEYKSKKSLDELANQLESEIATRREGDTTNLNVKDLVPGDVVLLVGGTIVPADTQWIKGDIVQVDTAPLTGEPLPRKYPGEHGDIILSGTTIVAGECYGRVVRTGTNTEVGKAQADVMADKTVSIVSVFQKKIMRVVQVLVTFSLVLVLAVLLVEGLQNGGFQSNPQQTILDALSILIASIPIALPLVIQVNLALGSSYMAKNYHAIVTSTPALQDIASMSMLCSDKTGTLTTANMSIINDQIFAADGFTAEQVILYAYLCSNPDKTDDPIDKAVINAFRATEYSSDGYTQDEIMGFSPAVKRIVAFITDQSTGKTITIAKGLPAKIMDTAAGSVDDHELQWKCSQATDKSFIENVTKVDTNLSSSGYKTIAVAVCEGNAKELGDAAVWNYAGLLPMLDPPRHDTPATIESLHHANISVKMITGDHANVGKETSRLIGLGTNIYPGSHMRDAPAEKKNDIIYNADGFAAVLPSDKREIVQVLRNHFGLVCGMTGDGVNDAPALSAAQVGIAVEGATDAAQNAADLILTEAGLSPIYGAVLESRRIFSRIKSYVVYRIAASMILVLVFSIVIFISGCAVDSLMVIILALLNDVSMIPVAYDNAAATTKPQLPKARSLVYQSLFYGIFHAALSLMFIFVMNSADLAHPLGLNDSPKCAGEGRGFIWFHLLTVTEMMIFSVRAPKYFFQSMPSYKLILSVAITLVGGGLLACLYPTMGLRGDNLGYILAFNAGSFIVVDLFKVGFRKLIGEDPGDTIDSDDLIEPTPKTEVQKTVEKDMRYVVHRQSVVNPEDRQHVVEVKKADALNFFNMGTELNVNDGFVNRRLRTSVVGQGGRVKQMSCPL